MSDNLIRANMELAREPEILDVIRKDAPFYASNCIDFSNRNLLEYYIIINTWLMITKQYSKYGWMRLWDAIHKEGLRSVIDRASSSALEVVQDVPITDGLFSSIFREIKLSASNLVNPFEENKLIGKDIKATALFVFRYPKRMTPVGSDLLSDRSLKDFQSVERRTKLLQRSGYSEYIISLVKYELSRMINWRRMCKEISSLLRDPCNLTLPTGAGLDARSSAGDKIVAISKTNPEVFLPIMGVPHVGVFDQTPIQEWNNGDTQRIVSVRAVPKSYKSSRIIAMEQTYRQSRAKAVSEIILRYIPDASPIHDQTVNQDLAWYGSVSGELATEDLTHASDCISKSLFRSLFPIDFINLVEPFMGTHTEINGKIAVMQQMSTAGNALTFVLETLVFLSIARAATHTYERFSDISLPKHYSVKSRELSVPSCYGDDLIVHSSVHETLEYFLSNLGFILNKDKSYAAGEYRESCGAEYINGVDVSSLYFPRFPIEGKLTKGISIDTKYRVDSYRDELSDSLTSLVSLQHRLAPVSYEAAYFLHVICSEAFPKMTSSTFGTISPDCWDYDDTFEIRYAPAGEFDTVIMDCKYPGIKRRILRKIRVEDQTRTAKFSPDVQYKCNTLSEHQERLYEVWKYQEFLRNGPRYDGPLEKLLGITAKPITALQFFGTPTVRWSLKEIDYR